MRAVLSIYPSSRGDDDTATAPLGPEVSRFGLLQRVTPEVISF